MLAHQWQPVLLANGHLNDRKAGICGESQTSFLAGLWFSSKRKLSSMATFGPQPAALIELLMPDPSS